ncbi:hypothetical protein A1O1_05508 [Capronia coronata CBS 617.96]|uniref:Zn(2)-C6 fungal-type domain-containing protein n=1 Tax=Capronia coronata CBS 617.96 TaxID=1182541 RepID=W9Y7S5_9EURO|nr:uncharacterized protein A1O1_05508 [Capronia coronata CBS 617.96]EXJ88578.1 hypothetical protein A1O1_05508 [Capronia coronata CBS 617.96]
MPSRRVPVDLRKRTEISCDRCKSRKQKCHRPLDSEACRYCQAHHFDCVTTRERKKRIYGSVEGLGTRMAVLESLVKGLVPEIDTSNVANMRDLGHSLGIPLPPAPAPARSGREGMETGMGTVQSSSHRQADDARMLRDQQGQAQYIGPASSYLFQINIRTLIGRGGQDVGREFFLFGPNPTEQVEGMLASRRASNSRIGGSQSTSQAIRPRAETTTPEEICVDPAVADGLVAVFFDSVHPDFPVLHEASFREQYERWSRSPSSSSSPPDRTWLCSLLCVMILARHLSKGGVVPDQEEADHWWCQVQTLLPNVLFTSSVSAIQALMLTALHLNNSNHRDLCWTLTGAAVRIAFAIGLHREDDNSKPLQTPLTRELRKCLWWTLYEFEQMQVSSLDRPSAIEDAVCSTGCPRESILGMSGQSMLHSNRLVVLLGLACRTVRTSSTVNSEDAWRGPLSPTAALLRDLERWKQALPPHLSVEAVAGLPPPNQRTVLLLHIRYHYIVCLLTRAALLYRASRLAEKGPHADQRVQDARVMAEVCIESGRTSCQLLLKLKALDALNGATWFDLYYLYSACFILLLDIICSTRQSPGLGADPPRLESAVLLRECAALAAGELQNPMMPGTNHRYAIVITDLDGMANEFVHTTQRHEHGKIDHRTSSNVPLSGQVSMSAADPGQSGDVIIPQWAPSNIPDHQRTTQFDPCVVSLDLAASPGEAQYMATESTATIGFAQARNMQAPYLDLNISLPWQDFHWEDVANMLLEGSKGVE